MRLDRLDLPLPALPGTVPAATDAAGLDARTRQALFKLLGRVIDLVGEAETRALAPSLVAYLASPPYEAATLPAGQRARAAAKPARPVC